MQPSRTYFHGSRGLFLALLLLSQVYLWNLESGAVMRKLLAQELQARPPGERSVEAVAFMYDGLK